MPTTTSKQEIFSKVQEALVDALGVEEEEVTPEATLQGDLGAESIDFLDIVFRLEKAFDIKIDYAVKQIQGFLAAQPKTTAQ